MSDLTIELQRPLPERLRIGRGNALRVDAIARCRVRIVSLSLLVGEAEHSMRGSGGVRRRPSKCRLLSAVVPISPIEDRTLIAVRARATLEDGTEAATGLGTVRLIPDLEAGLGGAKLASARDELSAALEQARARAGAPLVAIAMASFDPDLDLFAHQVESIRNQTHEDWICVISDDCSPASRVDEMRAILGEDPRFSLLTSGVRRGPYENFERALVAVPGAAEFVALCDQGDDWQPEKLATLIGSFEPGVELVHGDLRVLRPSAESGGWYVAYSSWRRRTGSESSLETLLASSPVPGAGSLLRRELLDYALPFPDPEGKLRHDQWLALIALARGEVRAVDRVLSDRYETGAGNDPRSEVRGHGPVRTAARVLELRCHESLEAEQREVLDAAARDDDQRMPRLRSIRDRLRHGSGARARRSPSPAPAHPRTEPLAPASVLRPAPRAGGSGKANGAGRPRPTTAQAPPAIVVDGVRKSFRIPAHRAETLTAWLRHPVANARHDRFDALTDISFEVARGEFFGICGRNGSGKSTLLQVLANVYAADEGTVMIAPRVAPIIALGIGFLPELPAHDNVVLTAELLGVPAAEARRRFDEVIAFAELEDAVDLKVKNYSSGMRMRLAFGTVLLVDADVLLLDEMLAVGDEGFKKKADEAFTNLLADKTVVLVTHQMSYLQRFCNRAMLLEAGRIEMIGPPDEVATRYAEVALEAHGETGRQPRRVGPARRHEPKAEIVDLWLEDAEGARTASVPAGDEIVVRASVDVTAPLRRPGMRLEIRNHTNSRIFAPPTLELEPSARRLRRGERLQLETAVENKLAAGTYTVTCTVVARPEGAEQAVSGARTARFMIPAGASETRGVVELEHSLRITERGRRQRRPGEER